MLDVALLVGGALLILSIVPSTTRIPLRKSRARTERGEPKIDALWLGHLSLTVRGLSKRL
jgi:hypothetical protein